MKPNAVIVCVNFADYLVETLPRNREHFNLVSVVTAPSDKRTQDVCRDNDAICTTTMVHEHKDGFNKGAAVNVGLVALDQAGPPNWTVHTDADTILTPELVAKLQFPLNPKCIYGCHRRMCCTYLAYDKWLRTGTYDWMPHKRRTEYTLPVGYFQLWSRITYPLTHYDEDYPSAGHTDLTFSKKFSARCCWDLDVIHLSTPEWKQGLDHLGRTSSDWDYNSWKEARAS